MEPSRPDERYAEACRERGGERLYVAWKVCQRINAYRPLGQTKVEVWLPGSN